MDGLYRAPWTRNRENGFELSGVEDFRSQVSCSGKFCLAFHETSRVHLFDYFQAENFPGRVFQGQGLLRLTGIQLVALMLVNLAAVWYQPAEHAQELLQAHSEIRPSNTWCRPTLFLRLHFLILYSVVERPHTLNLTNVLALCQL